MTIPFIGDITIPPDTWTYADWLANETGTFSEIANAIGAALSFLSGTGWAPQIKTSSGGLTISNHGIYVIRKTVPATTSVVINQGLSGLIVVMDGSGDAAGNAGDYPITITIASGGTINGESNYYLARPFQVAAFLNITTSEYLVLWTQT